MSRKPRHPGAAGRGTFRSASKVPRCAWDDSRFELAKRASRAPSSGGPRLSSIKKWRKRNAAGCNRRACRARARLDGGDRTAQVRAGHIGQRDQGRPDHRLFGAGLGLRPARQGRGRLFQVAQRQGRHQRPQDQFHHPRRRLFAAQGGRERAQAGRERPGRRRVQRAGHAAQYGDPALPQPEEGAAALHRRRRHHLQRSPALSLDHGLAAQPAGRGDLLCRASAEEQTRTPRWRCSTRTTISARTCSTA